MGSDYGYFMPQLLAGYHWYQANGAFLLPWFTPAFCAGIPYYPNMQGMYLSVPQFLTFVVGPVLALQFTFLAFAGAGFVGFYILLRQTFITGQWVALAGSVLFLFNGFFAHRFIIGHLTFHAFMLAPLIAVCLLTVRPRATTGTKRSRILDAWVVMAGLMIAYMVQSGMVHALPPTLIAIVVFFLIHAFLFGFGWTPFVRFALACCIALALSAGKLVAAIAFMAHFPRDMLPLMGFSSMGVVAKIALLSLFVGSFSSWALAISTTQNNEWYEDWHPYLGPWDLEYGVTIVPAILIALGLITKVVWPKSGPANRPVTPFRVLLVSTIVVLLMLPIPLNWYHPTWTGFLESLPYFGNSMSMIRWLCMYVLVTVLIAALVLERLPLTTFQRTATALLIIVAVATTNAGRDRDYYKDRANYDTTTVQAAYSLAAQTGMSLPIDNLEWPYISNMDRMTRRDRNNSLTRGASQAECYEPMFGHRLEQFPFGILREGPMLEARNGFLNVKNPACFVYPEANNCKPGDHFREEEIDVARAFLSYRAFPFVMPWWQKVANWISLSALILVILGLTVSSVRHFTLGKPKSATLN